MTRKKYRRRHHIRKRARKAIEEMKSDWQTLDEIAKKAKLRNREMAGFLRKHKTEYRLENRVINRRLEFGFSKTVRQWRRC